MTRSLGGRGLRRRGRLGGRARASRRISRTTTDDEDELELDDSRTTSEPETTGLVRGVPRAPARAGAWCGTTRPEPVPREAGRADRRDGAARAERRLQPGPAAARRDRGCGPRRGRARSSATRGGRAAATASRGSRARRSHVLVCTREDDYHERYRLPDKLDGRRGDRLAGAVLVRRRRRCAHAPAARGDRRGAGGRRLRRAARGGGGAATRSGSRRTSTSSRW